MMVTPERGPNQRLDVRDAVCCRASATFTGATDVPSSRFCAPPPVPVTTIVQLERTPCITMRGLWRLP